MLYFRVARVILQGGRRKGSGAGGEVRQSATELRRSGAVERGEGKELTTPHHIKINIATTNDIHQLDDRHNFFFHIFCQKFHCHKTTTAFLKIFFHSFSKLLRIIPDLEKTSLSYFLSISINPSLPMYSLCSPLHLRQIGWRRSGSLDLLKFYISMLFVFFYIPFLYH